jgi:hypothetical protein
MCDVVHDDFSAYAWVMTVAGTSHAVPAGTRIQGSPRAGRLLLRMGEELGVFDLGRGEIVARRTFPELFAVDMLTGWIAVEAAGKHWLVDDQLAGEPFSWADADRLRFAGALGDVAVFSDRWTERMRFDLRRRVEIDRVPEDAEWRAAHAGEGLLVGVRESTRELVALRPADGAIVWNVAPFATKVDDLEYPIVHGDEVHVRATSLDESRVARLGVRDGVVRSVRVSLLCDSSLPEFGPDLEREVLRFDRTWSTHACRDGLVVFQEAQVILVRASGIARLATPSRLPRLYDDVLVDVIEDDAGAELVVVPLPEAGEHDVVVEPRGGPVEATEGERGKVTFAGTGAPVVIVQHPRYGRVTLTRPFTAPPPPVGAEVVLDGVEVTTGGTARVDRWWIAGARPPRTPRHRALVPPILTQPPAPKEPTRFTASLVARAAEAGVPVPDDVRRFVEVVDRDPRFRIALGRLGFRFEEEELGLDVLPDLDIEGFVPVWGNGYGDSYGGLTKDGPAHLWPKDNLTPSPDESTLAADVRATAAESEYAAAAEVVLDVLDREGLVE